MLVVAWRSRASARRGLSERSERGGRPSDAGCGVSCRGGAVKSPRLALERLQCNNSATLFAQRARGKSGRLEVWRAPGEKGAS